METPNDQQQLRAARRTALLTKDVDVYPARAQLTISIANLLTDWELEQTATIGGRVRAIRVQGGSAFLDLDDGTGKLQLFLQKKKLGEIFSTFTRELDLGDFIAADGVTFVTKAGEQSLNVSALRWLAKTMRPLPSSWHGVEDVELRYRHRELDLVTNGETLELFKQRSTIVQAVRMFLISQQFMEVDTPILQPLAGGASAKPFITHHNALNVDLFLRIAPELYLKRLIIGGLPRVFELARCFRNEGIDRDHNPEFSQFELYAAYQDYEWLMDFTERLIVTAATAVHEKAEFIRDGKTVQIPNKFPRLKYHEAILKHAKVDINKATDAELLVAVRNGGADVPTGSHRMKIIDELFKAFVRPKLISPTIVFDYPADMIPLAKKVKDNPAYVECFQVLMGGTELTKGFSELNDPVEQRARFATQEALRAKGDDEAQRIDEEFLQALEYGMPPTAGLGIGVDRLVALITGQRALKDVILFPTLKPSV